MAKYTKKQLDEAKRIREQRIASLQRCTCAFPVVTYRNGDGHDSKCPEHLHRSEQRARDDEEVDYDG